MTDFQTFWSVYSNLILTLGTNALLALSIWLTLSCGMLTIANAAFMGLGAYVSAMLTLKFDLPYVEVILVGMAVPSALAFLVGKVTLRLSGVYLAMATLAFGEVIRIGILNTEDLTGGALGLNGIPQLTQWWHITLAVGVAIFVLWRVRISKMGRSFEAIKEDETAASLMGIDVDKSKMLAFILGAAIAGLAGALNAHLTFFIGPNEYGFDRGVDILTMTVLGGINSIFGPILGSMILTILPELLRGFGDFRLVVNGFILVLIVLFLPNGIWDPARYRGWFKYKDAKK